VTTIWRGRRPELSAIADAERRKRASHKNAEAGGFFILRS
jgi:hypothetical protein